MDSRTPPEPLEVYAQRGAADAIRLWRLLHGGRADLLGLWSAVFTGRGDDRKLSNPSEAYFKSDELEQAAAWAAREDRNGREVYFSVAQLLEPRRLKDNAAPSRVVHADVDDGDLDRCPIRPTVAIESSPGRVHAYWVLNRWLQPDAVERFNRRMVVAIGADKAAVDCVRLLRVVGTHNRKREKWTDVEVLWIDEDRLVNVDELDQVLPKLPEAVNATGYRSVSAVDGDDQEVLAQLIERSPLFAQIWQGDTSAYQNASPSEIEWGLARDLVRACGGDVDRAEALMRRCEALQRPKWDGRRGDKTYLRHTLERAAAQPLEPWTPPPRVNATGYQSDDPSTWPEHVAVVDGPANGKCSAHCERHHAETRALKRQIELVNELIQSDISPIFRLVLLRLTAIVGFHQARGTTQFDLTAKKVAESLKMSAQSVRPVLHALARNDRDQLVHDYGIIDLDARRVPEAGEFCSVFEVTPLTQGGFVGFLEAAVALTPKLRPEKRAARVKEEAVEPPPEVDQIPNCPVHTMHSDVVTCADCGELFVREMRYRPYVAPQRGNGAGPHNGTAVATTGDIPQRSEPAFEVASKDLEKLLRIYDKAAAS